MRPARQKPSLIIGSQGSGKTLRLYKMLADFYPKKVVIKSIISVKYSNKTLLETEYNVLGVDEIATIEELVYIAKLSVTTTLRIVVATQLAKEKMSDDLLSFFQIIDMDLEPKTPATDENNK